MSGLCRPALLADPCIHAGSRGCAPALRQAGRSVSPRELAEMVTRRGMVSMSAREAAAHLAALELRGLVVLAGSGRWRLTERGAAAAAGLASIGGGVRREARGT